MDGFERIPPTRQAMTEALSLSEEILRNLEMGEIPLTNIALKTARLARLLNDFDYQKIMEFEAGGYPSTAKGVAPDIWNLGKIAGRVFEKKVNDEEKDSEYMMVESISALEETLRVADSSLSSAHDPDISVQSANPHQYVSAGIINRDERWSVRSHIRDSANKLASRRSFIYQYVLRWHYELKFSGVADDIFTRVRSRVDSQISTLIPDALERFAAVYDGLQSDNPENWANAVHSCRRILTTLADVLFPPTDEGRTKVVNGKTMQIKLGAGNYSNRLLAYVEDNSTSRRFIEICGSQIEYLRDRLDAVVEAANKGTHDNVSKEEADRYVVYTYLLVGDILSIE